LPQYHPKQLLELMNAGKINRVKAILMHLTRCIIDFEMNQKSKVNAQKNLKRKMSVCTEGEIPEEQVLNYVEVEAIPPLPLFALIAADTEKEEDTASANKNASKLEKTQESLFHSSLNSRNDGDDEDELNLSLNVDSFIDDDDGTNRQAILLERKLEREKLEFKKSLISSQTVTHFNSNVCKLLTEYLTHVQLSGLTSIDQMYLVALADTVANIKCDVNFSKEDDLFSRKQFAYATEDDSTNDLSVDNCGLKYMLALRSYNYLIRTLPAVNREALKEFGLGTANFAWAFHSECEQELLSAILKVSNHNNSLTGDAATNEPTRVTWADLRQYGVGWWLKNTTHLKQLMEKVAKYSFQQNNDPLDAALFYLAMKKKGVLWALFKTVKDTKMSEFFKNDFNEQKWQTASLKNAFFLLGKQRFEHAAAFFLLAGRLKDAIEVCIRNLNDLQLALVIIRLYESDFDQLAANIKHILCTEILGYKVEKCDTNMVKPSSFGSLSQQANLNECSNDPFLRSIAYWHIKDYKQALQTLYDIDIHNKANKSTTALSHFSSFANNKDSLISHVFNFYVFLKNHPLVLRQQLVEDSAKSNQQLVSSFERKMHFITAFYHLTNGCPLLSLDVLSKLPKYIQLTNQTANQTTTTTSQVAFDEEKKPEKMEQKIEKADQFDWSSSAFERKLNDEEDKLELSFGLSDSDDEDTASDRSDSPKKKTDQAEKVEDAVKQSSHECKQNPNEVQHENDSSKVVDTFAQQIKFISCLKILVEEMSTLATGFEVVGGQLRYLFTRLFHTKNLNK